MSFSRGIKRGLHSTAEQQESKEARAQLVRNVAGVLRIVQRLLRR
jgi:hypothetical protein